MPLSVFTIPARADDATPEFSPVWQTSPKPCDTRRVYSQLSNVRSLGDQSWSFEQELAGPIPRQDDSIDDYSSDLRTSVSWYDAILLKGSDLCIFLCYPVESEACSRMAMARLGGLMDWLHLL